MYRVEIEQGFVGLSEVRGGGRIIGSLRRIAKSGVVAWEIMIMISD